MRASERAAAEALRSRSYDAALCAFTIHPLVSSEQAGHRLLDGLLADEPRLRALLR